MSEEMKPSELPSLANTCESWPGSRALSWLMSGAESATLITQPVTPSRPSSALATATTTDVAMVRFTGAPRLRFRRRCRSRLLIGSAARVAGAVIRAAALRSSNRASRPTHPRRGETRRLAGTLDLAARRLRDRGARSVVLRPGPGHRWLRSQPADRPLWLLRQPAGGAFRPLGLGVVPGHRPGRLRARVAAHRVLPALPAGSAPDRLGARLRSGRRGARITAGVRARAGPAPSSRLPRARQHRGAGHGDADRVLPDGLLLLGRLQRVAVSAALGGLSPPGATWPLGIGRVAWRDRGCLAQQWDPADRARGAAVPLRAARRSPAAGGSRRAAASPASAASADPRARLEPADSGRPRRLPRLAGAEHRRRLGPVPRAAGVVQAFRRTLRRRLERLGRRLGWAAPAAARAAAADLLQQGRRRSPDGRGPEPDAVRLPGSGGAGMPRRAAAAAGGLRRLRAGRAGDAAHLPGHPAAAGVAAAL